MTRDPRCTRPAFYPEYTHNGRCPVANQAEPASNVTGSSAQGGNGSHRAKVVVKP